MKNLHSLLEQVIKGEAPKKEPDNKLIKAICLFDNLKKICNKKGFKMKVDKTSGRILSVQINVLGMIIPGKPIIGTDSKLYFKLQGSNAWFQGLYIPAGSVLGWGVNHTPYHLPKELERSNSENAFARFRTEMGKTVI